MREPIGISYVYLKSGMDSDNALVTGILANVIASTTVQSSISKTDRPAGILRCILMFTACITCTLLMSV